MLWTWREPGSQRLGMGSLQGGGRHWEGLRMTLKAPGGKQRLQGSQNPEARSGGRSWSQRCSLPHHSRCKRFLLAFFSPVSFPPLPVQYPSHYHPQHTMCCPMIMSFKGLEKELGFPRSHSKLDGWGSQSRCLLITQCCPDMTAEWLRSLLSLALSEATCNHWTTPGIRNKRATMFTV